MTVATSEKQLIKDRIRELRGKTDFVDTLLESLVGYAIIVADFDGNIIAYNEGARKIYGYAPEEVIGKQNMEIFFPDNFIYSGELQKIIYRLMEEDNVSYEGEKIRENGQIFPAQILFTATKDKSGKLVGFIEIVQDLTERKRIEKHWWDSMSNFYKVVNNTADGIVITSEKGIVRYVNPATDLLFGRKSDDLKGTQFGFPIASGDTTEIEIIRKAGETVVAEMRVVETVWFDEIAHLISLHDITERKRMEEMIINAAKQWRTTFDSISEYISIHDREFKITRVNKSLCRKLNMEPQEIIGRYCYELFHGTVTPYPNCPYEKAIETKTATMADFFEPRFGIHMEITASPIFNESGEVINCVHIARDISRRKEAQQVRERLNQQLQTKVNELETFSYGIAHDLRSPLVSIEGFSRLLRDDMLNQDAEKVQEDIRLLESGVRKMQQFLNRTLEYSRAGYQVKRTSNVSFDKIVQEVVVEFGEQVRSVGATITVAEKFPRVYADRVRIREVLTNLIQNSIKYRDKSRPLKIEIDYQLSKDEIVFFVRDNGIGIDESETKKVFDLFYRGTAIGEGSGAGLAIVKRIIEAHGGTVWAEGEVEKGTTIYFTLPQSSRETNGDNNGEN